MAKHTDDIWETTIRTGKWIAESFAPAEESLIKHFEKHDTEAVFNLRLDKTNKLSLAKYVDNCVYITAGRQQLQTNDG